MTRPAGMQARRARPTSGPVRSLHILCIVVQLAECDACGASGPGNPCVRRAPRADGMHVARFAAARRQGAITSEELGSVLWALRTFTNSTVVFDEAFGRATR